MSSKSQISQQLGVLILHGFLGGAASLQHVASAVGELGYPVVKPVLRGHGALTPDALRGVTWQDWADDAGSALKQVLAQPGVARVVVVGHSLGGLLALQLAAHYPAQVDSLVLAAPALAFRHWLTRLPVVYRFLARGLHRWQWQDAAAQAEEPDSYTWTPMTALVALLECSRATRPVLPGVSAPACLFLGGRDQIVASSLVARFMLQTPEAVETTWYPTAGHRLYYGATGAEMLAATLTWLQTRSSRWPAS